MKIIHYSYTILCIIIKHTYTIYIIHTYIYNDTIYIYIQSYIYIDIYIYIYNHSVKDLEEHHRWITGSPYEGGGAQPLRSLNLLDFSANPRTNWRLSWENRRNMLENMGNVWETYGKHMGNIWETYAKNMGNICEKYGKQMGNIWETGKYGNHMGTIWEPYGNHMGTIWEPYGKHKGKYGKHMGTIWEPYGKHWETYGKIWETYRKHMGNIWENMGNIWETCGNMLSATVGLSKPEKIFHKPKTAHHVTMWSPSWILYIPKDFINHHLSIISVISIYDKTKPIIR